MSTSYSIYRFAKPTKRELSGIDYFSEYDSFYGKMRAMGSLKLSKDWFAKK